MTQFSEILDRRLELTQEVLGEKEKEYAAGDGSNRYHNFYVAAELLNCTPPEALMGMMAKHVYSVIDMLVAQGIDPYFFELLVKHIFDRSKEVIVSFNASSSGTGVTSLKGQTPTLEHLDEKIGDTINYLILLEGLMHQYIERNINAEE